jgi:Leucine-rich repeat (LRR) protein
LETLILGDPAHPGNKIFDLPASFTNLRKLKTLVACNNAFVEFPMVLTSMEGISMLDLSNNQLQYLPEEIGMMSGLSKLNVMNNQLTDVPVEIANLGRLSQFDYSGNNFSGDVQQKILSLMTGTYYDKPVEVKKTRYIKKKAPVRNTKRKK